jgi:hypothetical protein
VSITVEEFDALDKALRARCRVTSEELKVADETERVLRAALASAEGERQMAQDARKNAECWADSDFNLLADIASGKCDSRLMSLHDAFRNSEKTGSRRRAFLEVVAVRLRETDLKNHMKKGRK